MSVEIRSEGLAHEQEQKQTVTSPYRSHKQTVWQKQAILFTVLAKITITIKVLVYIHALSFRMFQQE